MCILKRRPLNSRKSFPTSKIFGNWTTFADNHVTAVGVFSGDYRFPLMHAQIFNMFSQIERPTQIKFNEVLAWNHRDA